ncbi:hypothetical protein [Phyllobacterium sp. K27]
MSEKRLYEVVNPSDPITFRATLVEAACIADRLRPAWYFVKDAETGEEPNVEGLEAEYDAIWKSAEKLASYADAYRSFLVGSRSERELLEEAVSRMSDAEAKAYRAQWHDKRRTSMNDICQQVWETAEKISAFEPEEAA